MNNTEYNLERALSRLAQQIGTQPFEHLLLSVLYSGKLIDSYMKEPHNLDKKKEFYLLFQSLYKSLEFKINTQISNQYLLQKQSKKVIFNEISMIVDRYANMKTNNIPLSMILQASYPNITLEQVKNQLKLSQKLYKEFKIIESYKEMYSAKFLINQNQHIKLKMPSNLWEDMNKNQQDYVRFERFLSNLQDKVGWNLQMQQKQRSSRLFYKVIQQNRNSQSTIAVKIEAKLQIDIAKLLFMLLEPQILSQYVPFVQKGENFKTIQQHSTLPTNTRTSQCVISVPYLAEDQKFSFYSIIYDKLATSQSFVIFAKSLSADQQFRERYRINSNCQGQMMTLHYCCIEIKILSQSSVYMKLVIKPHFNKKYFDFQKIKKAARIFYSHYFQNIRLFIQRQAQDKWKKLRENKKDFYQLLQTKIELFLKERK